MNEKQIFPNPAPDENVQPPMVFVRRKPVWEYKQVVRRLVEEKPLDEGELNQLGAEGWELSGVLIDASLAYYYFKRQSD